MTRIVLAVLVFVATLGTADAQTPHPFTGEWTVNIAKSQLSPDYPMTRGTLSVSVSADARMVTMASDVTFTSGQQQRAGETFPTDGTEISAQSPGIGLVAKWLDPRVLASIAKKGGVVYGVLVYEALPDGKTLIIRSSGTVTHTLIFERTK